LLHGDPGADWSLERLADAVAVSRSLLAERFTTLVGQPPMQYLARWRMQVASGMLREGNATVAEIAAEVGYESEAAFSRAFKRVVGVSPGAWRTGARAG
jgi:AraC-like DNA-binding protein